MIFIGYDEREHVAAAVCAHSMRSSGIRFLKHRQLRDAGLFTRPWRIASNGQYYDEIDGKPFSTQFSHTRFLIPEIARREGLKGWALFCDCDFLWLSSPKELLKLTDKSKAVMVCKHDFQPSEAIKMDNCQQVNYPRKNWSSMIMWNLDHPSNAELTVDIVNSADGGWLHAFSWLKDDEIGSLPLGWNFLLGHTPTTVDWRAIHFTDGGPWFDGWVQKPHLQEADDMWLNAAAFMSTRGLLMAAE